MQVGYLGMVDEIRSRPALLLAARDQPKNASWYCRLWIVREGFAVAAKNGYSL